jgi:hypothetical protein
MDSDTITHAQLLEAITGLRGEMREGFEKQNGRLRDVEVCQATNKANIENVREQVKSLSIVDKSVALLSGLLAAVIGSVVGNK